MARCRYLLAALLAATSFPAFAGVIVLGSSSARLCYEAADAPVRPTPRDLALCDEALGEPGISHHDYVATFVNRGILRLRRGLVEESIGDFDRAMALDPNQPEAYLNKGAALIARNDMQGALPLFTVALERRTNRPAIAHFGRAIANETLGNVVAAYRDYRRASELDPDWADPRTELRRFRVTGQQ
ncbi:MAG TPA: tetratricopeptide repeat protein [Allosphingosinicella sp.]|nr:tetratricopeptide repeat protein [Allosphingosinicella sp.]